MRIRLHKVFLFVLLLTVILLGGLRVRALASNRAASSHRNYASVRIVEGDSLWSIAKEYCGSAKPNAINHYIEDLKKMNHIVNEKSLLPGAYIMVYRDVYGTSE